ncbi:MAG: hypothetical protein KDC52_13645, partial [Ignavibacteriae bacterium]|nr:hypothetical protein [Ignavibacteriota bacterium]
MKTLNSLFRIITIIILIYSTIFAQLDLSVYTDKETYEYGETIMLYAKVTNTADTTFEFFAPTYQTCQAGFSFNNFNSGEYATCLATAELLTFKPHFSKIYSWRIEPQSLGLPNKNGTQTIIGKYYFDLTDTIYIQAPKFFGGEIELLYHVNNFDSVNAISRNLNADVVFGSDYGEVKHEVWQIEGFDIDSLVQIYSNDSIFVSFEKSIWIMYESIVDEYEFPIDYYPLEVGNRWYYEKIELENINDPIHNFIVTDTLYVEVLADTIMPNGKKYSILKNGLGTGEFVRSNFYGIYNYKDEDSSEVLVYNYFAKLDEYYPVDFFDISRVSLTEKQKEFIFGESINTLNYSADGLISFNITFAEGLGIIYSAYDGPLNYKIIGCKINGDVYSDTIVVGVKEEKLETIPAHFSLSQNYPNP